MGIILFFAVALILLTAVDAHLWPNKRPGHSAYAGDRRRTPRRVTPRRRSQRNRFTTTIFGLSVRDVLAQR